MATDSRWWWWIAGVPAGVAFWAITALWLVIATGGSGLLADPVRSGVGMATVGLGVPLLVIAVLFPVAVFFDARELREAGLWEENHRRLAGAAALSLLTGPVLSVPLASWYLWQRHRAVGVP
jgi:hypothetical protein